MSEGQVESHGTRVLLMIVEDTFWLKRPGVQMLVLHPNFPPPRQPLIQTEKVLVITPDGRELESAAEINVTHLNISDPHVPIEQRWRTTMWLTDKTPDEVPAGSKVFVSPQLRGAIIPRKS
jgi:hypothetical protein